MQTKDTIDEKGAKAKENANLAFEWLMGKI